MKSKILKRVITGLLVVALAVSGVMMDTGITALADVTTDTYSGHNVTNSGSTNASRGKWICSGSGGGYRVYVVPTFNSGAMTSDKVLLYRNYLMFKELALYELFSKGAVLAADKGAYTFAIDKKTGSIVRTQCTVGDMILGDDGKCDFGQIGLKVSLPDQIYGNGSNIYNPWTSQLSEQVKTEGSEANVTDILKNYIAYLDTISLSKQGEYDLVSLKNITGYGTDKWDEYCKSVALVFEPVGFTSTDGLRMAVSWGDLSDKVSYIGSDAYFVWKTMSDAETKKTIATWKATINETGFSITPEINDNVVFCSYNVKGNTDGYSQGINATLSYTGDVKANINDAAESALGISTSAYTTKTATLKYLGGTVYKSALFDVFANSSIDFVKPRLYSVGTTFNNSLLGTAGSNISNNKLNIPDSTDMLYGVSGYGNLNDANIESIKDNNLYLKGYKTVAFTIKDNSLSLSNIYNTYDSMQEILKNVRVKTVVSSVSNNHGNAFGSSYNINFTAENGNLVNSMTNAIIDNATGLKITDASLVVNKSASYSKGKVVSQADSNESLDLLANLQGATLLAGKITSEQLQDDGIVKDADGTMYATFSYFVKRTYVKSKMTKVDLQQQINENGEESTEIQNIESTKTAQYLVEDSKTWETSGSGDAFAIVYRTSDYNLTDGFSLVTDMISKLPNTISKENGASNLASVFHDVTGAEVQGYKYLGKGDTSISVGSMVKDSEGNLDGLSVLVIYVNAMNISSSKSVDSLDSDELNYVYPSLLGQRSNSSGINSLGSGVDDMVMPYSVNHNISGHLLDFKGTNVLYYYPVIGLFGLSSQNTKSFSQTSYPSYAYNISRALWGDNLVISNYKGLVANSSDLKNYIRNVLGLSIGVKGQATGVTAGINVDATINDTKHDNYNFVANILRRWYTTEHGTRLNKDGEDETYSYQKEHTENVTQSSSYAITHYLNKYDPLVLPTAGNDNSGSPALSIQTNAGIENKLALVGMSNKKLMVYGEVPFKLYYPYFSSNGVLSAVSPMTVYAMSEKVRSMTPTVLNGYKLDYDGAYGVAAHGGVSSETAASGTNANALSQQYSGLPVMYAGGNINFHSYDDIAITLSSYALDITHASINGIDVRNEFSSKNALYKSDEEHEAYVDWFRKNLKTDITMKSFNGNTIVKTYDMTQASTNSTKVIKDTESSTFSLEFKSGKLTDETKDVVISDMATTYGITKEKAIEMFNRAGFEKQIKDMFLDCLDANNKSDKKWYTEDSITLIINKYTTVVKGGETVLSTKIDINAGPSQDIYNIKKNGTTGYRADFFISLSLPVNFNIGENTYNLQGKNMIIKEQIVKDASFVISSSTTSDMRR